MNSDLRRRLRDAPALRSVAARYRELGSPLGDTLVTRFAPSPTGEMHLGHVAHALWVWGVAEVLGAKVIIRMEDHDRSRCTPGFERSILEDLAWLGFLPEPESLASLASRPSPFRQSDMRHVYEHALVTLRAATEVYGCTCTRSQLGEPDEEGERRYPGTCRGQPESREGKHVIRARIPDGEVVCEDLRLGTLMQDPQREQGDVVVKDAQGQWTYQFAVVVDDTRHGVNLIVRGEDLVRSTGRQVLLAGLLGRTEPIITVHHPLVFAADGKKLSKRDRSETVRAMRAAGMPSGDVVAHAAEVSSLT